MSSLKLRARFSGLAAFLPTLSNSSPLTLPSGGGPAKCYPSPLPPPSLPSFPSPPPPDVSGPRNSTEPVADWGEGQFHSELQVQLLVVRPVLVNCSPRHTHFPERQKYELPVQFVFVKARSETFYLFLQILSKGNVCPALGLYVLYLFDHNHLG